MQYLFDNSLNIFLWYCYIIGLLGNTLTLTLLLKRVLRFKLNLISRNKSSSSRTQTDAEPQPTVSGEERISIRIHRSNLVDRRNNWTLYYYIIGILISDIFILVCWVVSKLHVTVQLKSEFTYE